MDNLKHEGDLIAAALVREISRADTWAAIRECWFALLNVRREQDALIREQEHLGPVGQVQRGTGIDMTAKIESKPKP